MEEGVVAASWVWCFSVSEAGDKKNRRSYVRMMF